MVPKLEGVPHCRQVFAVSHLFDKHLGFQLAFIEESIEDDHHDGYDHNDEQQYKADNGHHFVHIQPFPSVHGCELCTDTTQALHADAPSFFAG